MSPTRTPAKRDFIWKPDGFRRATAHRDLSFRQVHAALIEALGSPILTHSYRRACEIWMRGDDAPGPRTWREVRALAKILDCPIKALAKEVR